MVDTNVATQIPGSHNVDTNTLYFPLLFLHLSMVLIVAQISIFFFSLSLSVKERPISMSFQRNVSCHSGVFTNYISSTLHLAFIAYSIYYRETFLSNYMLWFFVLFNFGQLITHVQGIFFDDRHNKDVEDIPLFIVFGANTFGCLILAIYLYLYRKKNLAHCKIIFLFLWFCIVFTLEAFACDTFWKYFGGHSTYDLVAEYLILLLLRK